MNNKENITPNLNSEDYMRGYRYASARLEQIRRVEKVERIAKFNQRTSTITWLALALCLLLVGISINVNTHKANAEEEVYRVDPIEFYMYINNPEELHTAGDFNTENRERTIRMYMNYSPSTTEDTSSVTITRKEITELVEEAEIAGIQQISTVSGNTVVSSYNTIQDFEDWEVVELQKLAVGEGGFTEDAMQACAFSAIQTAKDKGVSLSEAIYCGKYDSAKDGNITINGREITEEEYFQAADAVQRAISEGAGVIGDALYSVVVEKGLDPVLYYGNGPTYFYNEKYISSRQKKYRENIQAKVYDPESSMWFYAYWDK